MTIAELIGRETKIVDCIASEHYRRGVDTGKDMEHVTISVNNVWGGRSSCGGSVSSYEKIGYHAGSVEFIAGVLSTGCPVRAYRDGWHQVTWR